MILWFVLKATKSHSCFCYTGLTEPVKTVTPSNNQQQEEITPTSHPNNPPANSISSQPSSGLLDLANPQKFELGQGRQRITKSDFTNPTGGLRSALPKSDDPLSGLDPLWSISTKK